MEEEQGFQMEVERLQKPSADSRKQEYSGHQQTTKGGRTFNDFFWKAEIGNVHSPESLIIVNNRMYSSTLLEGLRTT